MVLVTAHPFWWPFDKNQTGCKIMYTGTLQCPLDKLRYQLYPPVVTSKEETWSVSSVDLYSIFKLSEFIQFICKTSCPMTWHFGWALSPTVWCHILAVLKTVPSPSYNTGLQPLDFLHCSYVYGNKYKTFFPPRKFFIADTMKVKKSIRLLLTQFLSSNLKY